MNNKSSTAATPIGSGDTTRSFPYIHPLPPEIAIRLTEEVDQTCRDCTRQMVAVNITGGRFPDDENLHFDCSPCSVGKIVETIPDWVPVATLISTDSGTTTTLGQFAELSGDSR